MFNQLKSTQMQLKFKQEKSGRWYIVLPEWTGSKSDLEMVSGADDLLTGIAKGRNTVELVISLRKKHGYKHLRKVADSPLIGGAIYFLDMKPIWLCAVTETVFGKMPKDIYFKDSYARSINLL
jgi:hypothetical protein